MKTSLPSPFKGLIRANSYSEQHNNRLLFLTKPSVGRMTDAITKKKRKTRKEKKQNMAMSVATGGAGVTLILQL